MKKLLFTITLTFALALPIFAQSWHLNNPTGLFTTIGSRQVILTPTYMSVTGLESIDVILYDSIGHFIQEYKYLNLESKNKDDQKAYRRIYDFIVKENGWTMIMGAYIQTLPKEYGERRPEDTEEE